MKAEAGARFVLAAMIVVFAIAAVLVALNRHVRDGTDEVAHVSYVAHIQENRALWPSLGAMRLVDADTFRFTGEANYLNHPPLFYQALALAGPRLHDRPAALVAHRLLNVLIAVAGLALALAVGSAAGLQPPALYAYGIPVALIPVLVPLAGSVNNDNAAFAGGALATLGTLQVVATGRPPWLYTALAGFVIAALAKLTGLLLAGGLIAGVLAYLWWRGRMRREWWLPAAIAGVVAVAPYLVFLAQYGSAAPETAGQLAHLATQAREFGWIASERLSFPAYAAQFFALLIRHSIPFGTTGALYHAAAALLVGAVLCGAAGLLVSARRIAHRSDSALDVIVVCGWAAILATLAIHIGFSYGRYLATGWPLDTYPRYYLPLAAIIPLGGIALLQSLSAMRARGALIAFLIVGPIIYRLIGI